MVIGNSPILFDCCSCGNFDCYQHVPGRIVFSSMKKVKSLDYRRMSVPSSRHDSASVAPSHVAFSCMATRTD